MVFDKDAFVQENWNQLCLIGRTVSYKLHGKFKSVASEDLYVYAMYGVLRALLYTNVPNKMWQKYLYQYGYHHAYTGALRMLGMLRVRTLKLERKLKRRCLIESDTLRLDDDTLMKMYRESVEAYVSESKNLLPDIIVIEGQALLRKCLRKSLEGQVFEYVVRDTAPAIIARKLRLSMQTLHVILLRIVLIYCLAGENLSYQHLLTPPRYFLLTTPRYFPE